MQFYGAYALAQTTQARDLSEAWGISEDASSACAREERPMTIREAGALAELHGLRLEDVLAI